MMTRSLISYLLPLPTTETSSVTIIFSRIVTSIHGLYLVFTFLINMYAMYRSAVQISRYHQHAFCKAFLRFYNNYHPLKICHHDSEIMLQRIVSKQVNFIFIGCISNSLFMQRACLWRLLIFNWFQRKLVAISVVLLIFGPISRLIVFRLTIKYAWIVLRNGKKW